VGRYGAFEHQTASFAEWSGHVRWSTDVLVARESNKLSGALVVHASRVPTWSRHIIADAIVSAVGPDAQSRSFNAFLLGVSPERLIGGAAVRDHHDPVHSAGSRVSAHQPARDRRGHSGRARRSDHAAMADRRIGERRLTVIGTVLSAIGLFVMALSKEPAIWIGGLVLFEIGLGADMVAFSSWIHDFIPSAFRGSWISATSSVRTFVGIAGTVGAGALIDSLGYTIVWIAAAIVTALSAAPLIWLASRKPDEA
jgi:hypothetical protein